MADRGLSSARSAQIATYATRRPKDNSASAGTLFDRWRSQAAALGVTAATLDCLADRVVVEPPRPGTPEAASLFEALAAPGGITNDRSTFSYGRLLEAICDRLPSGGRVEDVVALADAFIASDHVVELDPGAAAAAYRTDGRPIPGRNSEGRWTTREMVATEQHLLHRVASRSGGHAGTVRHDLVEAAIARHPELAGEQMAMIHHLCESGNGVDVVIGLAGSGKTTALATATEAWHHDGYRVTGTALAARTALRLQEATGIPSLTMARLLGRLDRAELVLTDRDVVVLDEAGMVGTRHLARLVDHADTAGAKVVLIGDPRQLPELDAGGTLRALEHRTGAIALTANRRQREPWERDALTALRHGNPTHALAAYQAHGRIHTGGTHDLRDRLVAAWAQDRRTGEAMMVAGTRGEVEDLNHRARALLQATGDVGPDEVTLGARSFAPGDTVLALRNDPATGLLNGTRGRLEQIDTRRRMLVVRTEHDRGVVGVPFRYAEDGHLTHGYAMTIHKAQGATVDTCRILVGDSMRREQLYTALSRGRSHNHLYVEDPDRRGLDRHVRELTPTADQRLQSAVARSGAHQMAVDHENDGLVPLSVLRAERDRLQQILAGAPHDPTADLKRLADERRDAQRRLARAGQERARVQHELDGMPLIVRLRHRERRVVLEHDLNRLDREIQAQRDRRHLLRRRSDDLRPAEEVWRAWQAEHKPDLDRLTTLRLRISLAENLRRPLAEAEKSGTPNLEIQPEPDVGIDVSI